MCVVSWDFSLTFIAIHTWVSDDGIAYRVPVAGRYYETGGVMNGSPNVNEMLRDSILGSVSEFAANVIAGRRDNIVSATIPAFSQ